MVVCLERFRCLGRRCRGIVLLLLEESHHGEARSNPVRVLLVRVIANEFIGVEPAVMMMWNGLLLVGVDIK